MIRDFLDFWASFNSFVSGEVHMRNIRLSSKYLIITAISFLSYEPYAADFNEAFYGSLTGVPSHRSVARGICTISAAARALASEPKGSEKAERSIQKLENIIKIQRFDRCLLEGEARSADSKPDYSRLDSEIAMSVLGFYDSDPAMRDSEYLQNILMPFQESISTIASLTHDYPELEVIGRLGNRGFWKSSVLPTEFKPVFRSTDELTHLLETMKALRNVALAIEGNKERDAIRGLKDVVKGSFAHLPRIINLAYRTFHDEINAYLEELVRQLPEDSSTPVRKLSIVEGLIKVGETVKLLPKPLRDQELIKKCIAFRDKLVKIIPLRIRDLEGDEIGKHLTTGPKFIREVSAWIKEGGTGEVPNSDVIDNIRDALGYKANWSSKAGSAPIPDPDNTLLVACLDRIEESVHRERLKFPAWDSALFSLQSRIDSVARTVLNAEVEELRRTEHTRLDLWEKWRTHINDIVIVRTDNLDAVLGKIRAHIRGFPEVLRAHLPDDIFRSINWAPMSTFELSSLDVIRAEIHFLHSRATIPTDRFSGNFMSFSLMQSELAKLHTGDFKALRLIAYTVCQAIVDFPETFVSFEKHKSLIMQLRKYLAHARHDVEFPEIVMPYADGNNEQNERTAMIGLYFLLLNLT